MKRFKEALCLMVILSSFLFAQQPAWRVANGTLGKVITDIDIYFQNPDTMYAGGRKLLISTDRGENWSGIPTNNLGYIQAFKVDPFNSNRLYASHFYIHSLEGLDVSLSNDGGSNWTLLWTGYFYPAAVVEIDPVDLHALYAGKGSSTIKRSFDHGQTWESLPQTGGWGFSSLAISPVDNNIIYAAFLSGIYKSTDRGSTWTDISPGVQNNSDRYITVHPQNPDIVYAALFSYGYYPGGVYKTTNGGQTWTEMNNGLTSDDWDIKSIAINPKNPQELFIGTGSAQHNILFKTTDGGEYWFEFSNGLPDSGHVHSILFDTSNTRIYATVISSRDSSGLFILDSSITNISASDNLSYSKSFNLMQNYPNPFNSSTRIKYTLPDACFVELNVYAATGKKVIGLVSEYQRAGMHQAILDGADLPSGIYFYRLKVGKNSVVRKALLIQ